MCGELLRRRLEVVDDISIQLKCLVESGLGALGGARLLDP